MVTLNIMKVVGTVTDSQFNLVGLVLTGKAWEFNGIGNGEVTTTLTLQYLMERGFSNDQVTINASGINLKCSNKLSELKMYHAVKGDGQESTIQEISNKVVLARKVMVDGEIGGYDAYVSGQPRRIALRKIYELPRYYDCNYIVKTRNSKPYLCGKPGEKIEDLPEIDLHANSKKPEPQKTNTTNVEVVENTTARNSNMGELDIIGLSEALIELGGKFIYLPGKKYNKLNVSEVTLTHEFLSTGIQIANPELQFSIKNPNITVGFREIGKVLVNVNGYDKPYYPFAYKSKTLFEANSLNVDSLGIVIEGSKARELQSRFSGSLGLSIITDEMTNMFVRNFLNVRNPEDYVLLNMDINTLCAMSKNRAYESRLDVSNLYKVVRDIIHYKVCISYVNEIMKKSEEASKQYSGTTPRPVYGPYSMLSNPELEAIQNSGINVYTNEFIKREAVVDIEKESKIETDVAKAVKITTEFGIAGYKVLPNYNKIKSGDFNAESYKPEIDALARFDTTIGKLNTLEDIFKVSKEAYDSLVKSRDSLIKTMWLNNIACTALGDGQAFIPPVASAGCNWELKKALKGGNTYVLNDPSIPGQLQLNLYGIPLIER